MSEGLHKATITRVAVGAGYADITFADGDTKEDIVQRFFFQNFDGTDTAYLFKQLMASLAEDAQELWALSSSPERVTEYLGATVNLSVGNNGGTEFLRTPAGFTAAGHVAATLTELKEQLLGADIKLYRQEIKEIHSDDSITKNTDTAKAGTGTTDSNTSGRTKIPASLIF